MPGLPLLALSVDRPGERPARLQCVPAHPEQARLAERPQDPRLLVPFGHAVYAEELVQGPVKDLGVLAQHLWDVLQQRDRAAVLSHVGHDPAPVQPQLVLAERGLPEVASLVRSDYGLTRQPPALHRQVGALSVNRIGQHGRVAANEVAVAIQLRYVLVTAFG